VRWDFYGCRTSEVITLRPSSNVVASHGSVPTHYNNMVAVVVEVQLAESSASTIAEQRWIQLNALRAPALKSAKSPASELYSWAGTRTPDLTIMRGS
jgi:hypothetical protein